MDVSNSQEIKTTAVFSKELMITVLWIATVLLVPGVVAGVCWELLASILSFEKLDQTLKIAFISILAFPLQVLFLIRLPQTIKLGKIKRYYSIKTVEAKTIMYCLVAAVLYSTLIESFYAFFNIPTETFMYELKALMESNVGAVIIIFSSCFCAPIVEECLFRGILYNYFSRKSFGDVGAIIITSVIFSAIHFQYGDFFTFTTLFLSGILYGVVRYKTKNIIYPIIMHSAHNAFALIGTAFI